MDCTIYHYYNNIKLDYSGIIIAYFIRIQTITE